MQLNQTLAMRLAIGALCVAATQIPVWQLKNRAGALASAGARLDVKSLPFQLGKWSGTTTELDPKLVEHVGAMSIADRSYRNDTGLYAALHMATFPTADVVLSHGPRECYSSAGWTLAKDNWCAPDHDRRYRLMRVERDNHSTWVIYWYQIGPDVVAEHAELRKVMQKLRAAGKAWPPIVKVLLQLPEESTEDSAKTIAEDLGAGIYGWIKDNS